RIFGGERRLRILQPLLRIVVVGINSQSLLIIGYPFLVILQVSDVGVPAFRINVRIRLNLQTFVVIRDRFVELFLAAINESAALIGLRIVRIFLYDRRKISSRFVPVSQ